MGLEPGGGEPERTKTPSIPHPQSVHRDQEKGDRTAEAGGMTVLK